MHIPLGNFMPDEEENEEGTCFEADNGNHLWSMEATRFTVIMKYIDQHRVARFRRGNDPFSLKYVDSLRQTRTRIDNASKHTLND